MKCDICGKDEATIHITEIINDEAKELHVCQNCAEAESIKMQHNFGISDLLSGLVDFPSAVEQKQSVKCPNCGMTYDDFKSLGKLGCSECYVTFRSVLIPLIKNIHGSAQHVGKELQKSKPIAKMRRRTPIDMKAKKIKVPTLKERIEDMRERLQKAIQLEEYEQAAALRDKIKSLERKDATK